MEKMRTKKLAAVILVVSLLFCGFLSNNKIVQAALPGVGNIVSPRWVTVQRIDVLLNISGKTATCKVDIVGYSDVSSIAGTLKLIVAKQDGTVEQVASWYLTGDRNLVATKTVTVSSSGIYQLSFNGTVTTKDGRTENVTASKSMTY